PPTVVPPTLAPTPLAVAAQPETTPVPTDLYPNGQLFTLFWDDNTFYTANQSEDNILIARVAFERVLTSGGFAERYQGKRWAAYYPYNEVKKCEILKAANVYYFPRQECPYGINGNLNALKTELFWTSAPNSTEFRVLWNNNEIARCQLAQNRCEVHLPPK